MTDHVGFWVLLVAAVWLPLHWAMYWPLLRVTPVPATVRRVDDQSYGKRREYSLSLDFNHNGLFYEVEIEHLPGDDRPCVGDEIPLWRHPYFDDIYLHEKPTYQNLFVRSWRHYRRYVTWFFMAYAGYTLFT